VRLGGHTVVVPPSEAAIESHGTPHAPERDVNGHAQLAGGGCTSASTGTQMPLLRPHANAAHHSVAAHCAVLTHVFLGTQNWLAESHVYAMGQLVLAP
jgi:hypothetical protein